MWNKVMDSLQESLICLQLNKPNVCKINICFNSTCIMQTKLVIFTV